MVSYSLDKNEWGFNVDYLQRVAPSYSEAAVPALQLCVLRTGVAAAPAKLGIQQLRLQSITSIAEALPGTMARAPGGRDRRLCSGQPASI